jgi:hypothetical protein
LARDIRAYCIDTATPPPSAIISSGRGIYAKWYWTEPVGREGIGHMVSVNRALVRRLDRFGADRAATDCTRVLRITGSEHTGAKRLVSVLHQEQGIDGRTITYDFNAFARQIAPGATAEPEGGLLLPSVVDRNFEARRHPGGRAFTREGWHWAIIEDCHLLARLRWGGMVPEGWRDIFCHVMACQLARIFAPGLLYHEIVAHARLIMPADYVTRDLAGHCSTLLHRARQQHGYRYRKVSLIDLLRITPDEERQMRALISSAEKKRREAVRQLEQRRAAGVAERVKYEAAASACRPLVITMRHDRAMSWRAIGAALGISEGEARRLARTGA